MITTEMAHATEEATASAYDASGVEKYEYLATLETHTCDICRHLDGKVFELSERVEGVNYPVIHAHCRCTTAPWYDEMADDKTPRWARSPENERVIQPTHRHLMSGWSLSSKVPANLWKGTAHMTV